MGSVFQKQGKLGDAIATFQRALAINPDHAETLYNIGSGLRKQQELDDAIETFKRAHEVDPDYAEAETQMLHLMQLCCDWRAFDQIDSLCLNTR